ncbi:MAG: OmpA family protein [Magnetococcus sp. XQGC-1]
MAISRPSRKRGPAASLLTWLSLLLLLLSCFVFLFSMAQVTRARFDKATESFRAALGLPHRLPQAGGRLAEGVQPVAGVQPEIGLVRLKEKTEHLLAGLIDGGGVELAVTEQGFVVRFANHLLFAPGTLVVRDAVKPSLLPFARMLAELPNRIRVVGHTDDQSAGFGMPFQESWSLSALAASALVHLLVTEGGVGVRHLEVRGMGQYAPRADNGTEAGRSQNRRVEVIIARELASSAAPVMVEPQRLLEPAPPLLSAPAIRKKDQDLGGR